MTFRTKLALASALTVMAGASAFASEPLFETVGAPTNANLADHVSAAQKVKVNRRALNAPSFDLDLFGETVTAVRDRIERKQGGTLIWYGHVGGNVADGVIVTMRGSAYSARIDYQGRAYQITGDRRGGFVLNEIDFAGFPQEEPDSLPDGGGNFAAAGFEAATDAEPIQQDLLIAYSDDACEVVGGTSGVDCSQIEADITAAIADMNASYVASNVDITMNLVGFMEVDYVEDGKGISQMLSELRSTSDGIIDEVHPEPADALGHQLSATGPHGAQQLARLGPQRHATGVDRGALLLDGRTHGRLESAHPLGDLPPHLCIRAQLPHLLDHHLFDLGGHQPGVVARCLGPSRAVLAGVVAVLLVLATRPDALCILAPHIPHHSSPWSRYSGFRPRRLPRPHAFALSVRCTCSYSTGSTMPSCSPS